MPSLIVVGKKDGELQLESDVTVIGRDRGVQLELGDFQVSRRHALVVRTDRGTFVKDLGSRNGVLVNKNRVPSRREQLLKNGDVLTVGRTSIVYKDVAPGAPAPVVPEEVPAAKPVEAKKAQAPRPPEPKKREPAKVEAPPPSPAPAPTTPPTPKARFQELAADDVGAGAAADSGAIAAALAPGRDQVAFRELLRRSERERVFYRNLALGMVAFLMLVLVALLFYALGRSRGHEEAAPPRTGKARPAEQDPAATPEVSVRPVPVPLGRAGQLDARAFADTVGPVLVRTCATSGCHLAPRGAGELALEPGADDAQVARNFAAVERFVVPGRPERSPLLTKPLRRDEGGEGHGGGDVLAAQSPGYQTLRAWIAAGTAPAEPEEAPRPRPRPVFAGTEGPPAPPAPEPAPAASVEPTPHQLVASADVEGPREVGASLAFDGAGSRDPSGCALSFRWALVDRPEGSRAELAGAQKTRCTLVPDQPGSYLVVLVVSDGSTTSEPARVSVEVARKGAATPAPASTAGPATLAQDANGRLYVRETFIDLLGRGPKPEELDKALGQTREAFLADLFGRDELYEEWYERQVLYFLLLDNFRPATDPAEVARRLKSKDWTVRDAIQSMVIGQAFNLRNPGNDTFVTVVLEQLLGLKVQDRANKKHLDAGKKMYDGYPVALFGKPGKSQSDVVKIVVGERGFLEHLVRRSHKQVIGVDATTEVVSRATDRLEKSPDAYFDLLREWVSSPAYLDRVPLLRAKNERAYLRTLFQDLCGRLPDDEELRSARNGLRSLADTGPLKAVLAKVLLDSSKAKIDRGGHDDAWVRDQFRRLLARDPKTTELTAFTRSLGNGTTRETALRAIVTSAEYEGY